jgi:hypothetical protein
MVKISRRLQEAYDEVSTIAMAVAYVMNNEAQCMAGVALLEATAGRFGHQLSPHAVSLLGQNQNLPTNPTITTGRLAQAHARSLGMPEAIGYVGAAPDGSEFQRAGHMVAVLNGPDVMFDPTFGQFSKLGFPDLVPREPIDVRSSIWQMQPVPGVGLLYIVDDDNQDWQVAYRRAVEGAGPLAKEIADYVRRGSEPHKVPLRFVASDG